LTAQLDVADNIAVGPIFSVTGGAFDAPRTAVQRALEVGEMTIELTSCISGNVTYSMLNGQIVGSFDIMPFEKVSNPGLNCD